jgi:hypothetical protein
MKKLLSSSMLLLSLAFYFAGCSDKDDPAPTGSTGSTTSFKFLAAGRTLNYDMQSPFFTDTLLSVTFSDMGGGIFKATQSSLPNNDAGAETYLKNCSGNLSWSDVPAVDCANIYMNGTRNVGDVYRYDEGGGDTAIQVVIAKNVSVTVPAGTLFATNSHTKAEG